jgi:hypothetical protein
MRKLLLVIGTTMCIVGMPLVAIAGAFTAQGEFIGRVDPRVTSLLAQYPGGGPALRTAIALLIESDPRLSDDVVFAARGATRAQKQAIGMGIADAARFFAICLSESCRAAEAALRQAIIFADLDTRAAFLESAGSDMASNIAPTVPIFIPGIGTTGTTTSCVSPSSPSGC